jgi:hypothetical protein
VNVGWGGKAGGELGGERFGEGDRGRGRRREFGFAEGLGGGGGGGVGCGVGCGVVGGVGGREFAVGPVIAKEAGEDEGGDDSAEDAGSEALEIVATADWISEVEWRHGKSGGIAHSDGRAGAEVGLLGADGWRAGSSPKSLRLGEGRRVPKPKSPPVGADGAR